MRGKPIGRLEALDRIRRGGAMKLVALLAVACLACVHNQTSRGPAPGGYATVQQPSGIACPDGDTCNWTCDQGNCAYACAPGSTCNLECDGGNCRFDCE